MRITTHIRNVIFLWRMNSKNKRTEIVKIDPNILIVKIQNNYKRKNSWVRNQVALLIRSIRKIKPYQIVDYSKDKELYYTTDPIDLSKVKVGSYVVKYSEICPVKGKRWCDYHINFSSGTGFFEVTALDKYIDLVDYRGELASIILSEYWVRCFRFATKEEIKKFKIARKNYKQKKKEIEVLQEQINKLNKEL